MKDFIKGKIRQMLSEQRVPFKIDVPASIMSLEKAFRGASYDLFLVGGAVRDALLGKQPKDFDLATDALPDVVEELATKLGFKTLGTGKSFGVINVFTPDGEFEIATFRSDIGSDGRRPNSVVFSDIETDVKRRDLTINALFYDLNSHEIVDLVGGVDDLKKGVIRTVGHPDDRFGEDKLRIMRAIRFAGRFGSDLDQHVAASLRNNANLDGISGERIHDEFIKGIKSAKSVVHFLRLLKEFHLFTWIFKGLKVGDDLIETHDPIIVIAGLVKDNPPEVIRKQLNSCKFSVAEVRSVEFLVRLTKLSVHTVLELKKLQKISGITDDEIIFFAEREKINQPLLKAFLEFDFTVDGDELMQKTGLKSGKELGDLINKMELDNFNKLMLHKVSEQFKGRELFPESNERARKILSGLKEFSEK